MAIVINDKNLKATSMAEPTTTTGGGLLVYKVIIASLPLGASLLAFWLGMRFVPLRKGHERKDMINRVMACFVSAFALGVPCLVLLYTKHPSTFSAAGDLAALAGFDRMAGFFMLAGCVQLLCAIPGPWIVAALFLWFEKRKGKDIMEMVKELRRAALIDEAASQIADGNKRIKIITAESIEEEEFRQRIE